eukprot:767926-Hanusia_phi.AAC.3
MRQEGETTKACRGLVLMSCQGILRFFQGKNRRKREVSTISFRCRTSERRVSFVTTRKQALSVQTQDYENELDALEDTCACRDSFASKSLTAGCSKFR